MKNRISLTYKGLNRYRKLFQISVLLFFVAVPFLLLVNSRCIIGNLYSIRIFGLDIADPTMVLQTILLSKEFYLPLIVMALIPLILAAIFGRVFCSWMCPYNSLLELGESKTLIKILRKIGLRKRQKANNKNPKAAYYYIATIFFFIIAVIIGFPLIGFLSFPGIISSQMAAVILGTGIGLEIILFIFVFMIEFLTGKRFWCKYMCPVGVVLSLTRNKKTLRVVHDPDKCVRNESSGPCSLSCPLNLEPKEISAYPYCFNCGRCVKACEQTGNKALSLNFGNKKIISVENK